MYGPALFGGPPELITHAHHHSADTHPASLPHTSLTLCVPSPSPTLVAFLCLSCSSPSASHPSSVLLSADFHRGAGLLRDLPSTKINAVSGGRRSEYFILCFTMGAHARQRPELPTLAPFGHARPLALQPLDLLLYIDSSMPSHCMSTFSICFVSWMFMIASDCFSSLLFVNLLSLCPCNLIFTHESI